ncbi:MAG: hypothetical protein HUJ26_06585 [Planctomycetaceae bacterium]|nr:hypothetical protein [Planctomycetaceae bacterium]
MKTTLTPNTARISILVSCVVLFLSGCQSADSGGSFTGFTNPWSGVPSQSEPPIATLEPAAENANDAPAAEK